MPPRVWRIPNRIQRNTSNCLVIAIVVSFLFMLISSAAKSSSNLDSNRFVNYANVEKRSGVAAILPVSKLVQSNNGGSDAVFDLTFNAKQPSSLRNRLTHMERIVHLDLKGAVPKISYLEKLFTLLKSLGATGVLIEWEDAFPYGGGIEFISAKDCYTKEQVKRIYELAANNSLSVIPLVQTFGHMEFVLKGPELKHLREDPAGPQVINPHKDESMKVIKSMIDQQLSLQPDLSHIHIGADEVWALGSSNDSKHLMDKYGLSRDTMFLNHVTSVVGYIKNNYPHIKVLMWDDMFRDIPYSELEKAPLVQLVTPVVWKYVPETDTILKPELFVKYSKLFRSIWIATAFKGASGSAEYLTPIDQRYENHMAWLRILSRDSSNALHVYGTILTGWQRYDHFSTLCELLPVAIPSLAVCLTTMINGGLPKAGMQQINRALQCDDSSPIQWTINRKDYGPPLCNYTGHEILEGAYSLKNAQFYLNFLDSKQSLAGWNTDYLLRRNYTQTYKMIYLKDKIDLALQHLNKAETIMRTHLPMYFNPDTVVEWIGVYIEPLKELLYKKKQLAETALKQETWPRRPIYS